jgi:hypothetical protein
MWDGIGSRGRVLHGVEVCSRILRAQYTRINQAKWGYPSPAKYREPLHGLIYAGITTLFIKLYEESKC